METNSDPHSEFKDELDPEQHNPALEEPHGRMEEDPTAHRNAATYDITSTFEF